MNPVDLTVSQLWLPGQGFVPPHIRAAESAVKEYDADLMLGRHEQTGEWVVLLTRGPEGRPFPVFGLGIELPAPEQIKQRLYESDTRRNGREIVRQIVRRQEDAREERRRKAEDASGQGAEAFEWAHRKLGSHPSPRIFVPSKEN